MSRRFLEWRHAVFVERRDLLVVSGLECLLAESHSAAITHEATRALTRLCELDGVHVAIVSARPLREVAPRCVDVPRAWLIADGGRTVHDPHGGHPLPIRSTRASDPSRHGLREVIDRLPHGAATIVGVDERAHSGAIAAAHVRPTGLALHVTQSPDVRDADLTDGIVHGRAAWIELLDRLHGAIVTRARGITRAASDPARTPLYDA